MKPRHEIEVKLRVRSAAALRRRIKAVGLVLKRPRRFESNILFDFKDWRLRKRRSMLRLRFEGSQGVLTFKGAPLKTRDYKIRPEIETPVGAGEALCAVFEVMGLREVFRYEKYRTTFAVEGRGTGAHGPSLVFDETPMGNFIELEGPRAWIDHTAHALGYERRDYIAKSYATLFKQWREERGIKSRDMVFANSRRRARGKKR